MIRFLPLFFLPFLFQAFAEKKPNIVYVICDDLGYGDIQCLNPKNGKIPTPHVDNRRHVLLLSVGLGINSQEVKQNLAGVPNELVSVFHSKQINWDRFTEANCDGPGVDPH